MKKKISKIWGVGLTVVLVASLMLVAIPAAADPGTVRWSEVNNPNSTGTYATMVVAPSEIIDIEVANDGTMFAAIQTEADLKYYEDPTDGILLAGEYGIIKSTTGGTIWTATGFEPSTTPIVDIAVSPTYDEDSTLWVVTEEQVYRTINGGTTFGPVTIALDRDETITSIDVAPDYELTGLNAVVGTSDPGRVLLFTARTMGWQPVEDNFDAFGPVDSAFVAFSPNYESDGEIVAVCTTAAGVTFVRASFQERPWDDEVRESIPLQNEHLPGVNIEATDASIGFPDDYDSLAAINVFVGVTGDDNDGDVFWIMGKRFGSPTPSIRVDLNAHPTKVLDVSSIAVSGTMADGPIVIVGRADSPDVRKTTNPTDSAPSWRGARKLPTGEGNTEVKVAEDFATSNVVYAATRGASSALSRSDDGGSVFNGIALIDTEVDALVDVAGASKDVLFLITEDTGRDEVESLWRTSNGGRNWERVHTAEDLSQVKVSPEFADDDTLYCAHLGDTRIWKSANGGDTFIGVSAKKPVMAWTVVDATTLFTGDTSKNIWKSTNSGLRWTYASKKPAGEAKTIVISPNYDDDTTLLVGTSGTLGGRVYKSTDAGDSFRRVGVSGPGSTTDDIYVAFDSGYTKNSIIYAGSSGATDEGIFRWEVDVSTEWENIDEAVEVALAVRGLVVSADGVLYATNETAGAGMERSTWATGPMAKVAEYFQTVDDALAKTATLTDLEEVAGSLFAIDDTNNQLQGYKDTLSKPTKLKAPKKGAVVKPTVTLSWGALTKATLYEGTLALDPAFKVVVPEAEIASTPATSVVLRNLVPGTLYYWRVRAKAPVYSPWASSSFVVVLSAPAVSLHLAYPSPGATDVAIRPTFQWTPVTGATGYELQVADNPFYSGENVWTKKPLTHTVWAWDTDLEYATTYYWRVKAVKAGRGIVPTASDWSEATFTTIAAPVAPLPVLYTCPTCGLSFKTSAELEKHWKAVHAPPPPAPPAVPVVPPTPGYIWAIIVIGAVLVIAVIVLIVRTRRVV